MKTCSICKEEKSSDDFYSDPSYTDGKQGSCKQCRNEYQKQYRIKMEQDPKRIQLENLRRRNNDEKKRKNKELARFTEINSKKVA